MQGACRGNIAFTRALTPQPQNLSADPPLRAHPHRGKVHSRFASILSSPSTHCPLSQKLGLSQLPPGTQHGTSVSGDPDSGSTETSQQKDFSFLSLSWQCILISTQAAHSQGQTFLTLSHGNAPRWVGGKEKIIMTR